MTQPTAPAPAGLTRALAGLHRLLGVAALVLVVVAGVGLLAGWTVVTRVRPEWPQMYPYTVAGSLVLLTALWLIDLGGPARRRVGRGLAILVAVLASGVDLGVAAGLLPSADSTGDQAASWVTAIPTLAAVALVVSIALLDVGGPGVRRARFWIAAVAAFVPLLGVLSYLYQSVQLFHTLGVTGTSLPTSVLGLLVAGTSMTARPDDPPLAALAQRYDAGLVYRVLPLMLALPIVPPVVAALVEQTEDDAPTATALAALVTVVIMLAVVAVAGGGQSRARRALSIERAQVWAAFAHAPSATTITSVDGVILLANPALGRLLDRDTTELRGRTAIDFVAAPDLERVRSLVRSLLAGERDHATDDVRLERRDGSRVWVEFSVARVTGTHPTAALVVVQFADLTQRKDIERALVELASTDRLTGLANREGLQQHLLRLSEGLPADEVIGLVFADVDGLKPLNDALGHAAGDDLLREAARRLQAASRATDLVARVGGDEFVVVTVLHADQPNLAAVVDRLRERLSGPVEVAGEIVAMSVSLGGSLVAGSEVDAALQRADLAMYEDKRSRRGPGG